MTWILMWLHKLPFGVTTEDYQLTCSNAELLREDDRQWKHAEWQAGHPKMSYLFSQWASELLTNFSLLLF